MPYFRTINCLLMLLLGLGILPGCEIGRTMFQYSSGSSSPFLGIDLVPRKKEDDATTIDYRTSAEDAEEKSDQKSAALQLLAGKRKQEDEGGFRKKPIRLDLPPSKQESDETTLEQKGDVDFSISAMRSRDF